MSASPSCPYPTCGNTIGPSLQNATCACTHAFALTGCEVCGLPNRIGAKFCRGCRNLLAAPETRDVLDQQLGPVRLLNVQDSFRRPPAKAGGLLYAVSGTGALYEISSRPGGAPRLIARLQSSSAGFNRFAVVDVAGGGGEFRGWTLFAAGAQGIEAVSLASGKTSLLFQPSRPEEMAVNRSDVDGTGFKGLVASPEFCAFVTHRPTDSFTLNLQYLNADRPVEQLVTLHGSGVAGPALCGRNIVFCTEAQIGVYDHGTRQIAVTNLPPAFRPLLTPSSQDLTIPMGGMPFAAATSPEGSEIVLLAGIQGGRSGLLHISFHAGTTEFRALPKGSSLTTNSDGAAVLRTLDGIELFGADAGFEAAPPRTQAGMPAFYDAPYLFTFGEVDFARQHRLTIARGTRQQEVRFEDARCDRYSCCGAFVFDREVILSFLDMNAADGGAGLVFAQWAQLQ